MPTVAICFLFLLVSLVMPLAAAASPEPQALRQEITALKERLAELEKRQDEASATAGEKQDAAGELKEVKERLAGLLHDEDLELEGAITLSQELARPREMQPAGILTKAKRPLSLYGVLEIEGSYENKKPKQGPGTTESKFSVATAEAMLDARANEYVRGALHFKHEDGLSGVEMDEAFLLLGMTEEVPFYALAGRIYPAVASFDTYMVSDPLTLNLFETRRTAAEFGWASQYLNLGAGAYAGDVQERGGDKTINSFYARVRGLVPPDLLGPVVLSGGLAYFSNAGDSNYLRDQVVGQRLDRLVGGWSARLDAVIAEVVGLSAEYVATLDDFKEGELAFAGDRKARPSAYALEAAYLGVENWCFAVRYEGTRDLFNEEPERQYGATVSWTFLPRTTLSLEYQRGEYENGDDRDLITTQLAVGF